MLGLWGTSQRWNPHSAVWQRGLGWRFGLIAIGVLGCTRAAPPIVAGSVPIEAPAAQAVLRPAEPPSDTAPPVADLPGLATPVAIVSELMTDPLLLDDSAGEYVELMLLSDQTLRVADLRLRLPSGKVAIPERPDAPLWRPGEVLLVSGPGLQPGSARAKGLKLPNPAGRLELWHRDQLLDIAHWHNKPPWWKRRPGIAQERVSAAIPGDQPRAWQRSRTVRRGQERGSPGVTQLTCRELLATPWGTGSGRSQLAGMCPKLVEIQVVRRTRPTRAGLGATAPERAPVEADWAPAPGRKPRRR